MYPGVGYPSQTFAKLNSRETSFARNLHRGCQIVLKFGTDHGSITAMLCAKLPNDVAAE